MKLIRSFGFAFKGLGYAFRTQLNFKIHTAAALMVCIMGYHFDIDRSEWLWIIAAMGIVFIAELTNTAVETLVDLVSPEYNPKAGIVKDLAAAVVLLSSITSVVIGLIIFLPRIFYAA